MAKTTTKAAEGAKPEGRKLEAHELLLMPTAQNGAAISAWGKPTFGEADILELVVKLREQSHAVTGGDMRHAEAMLYGQSVALQTIFTTLSRRAANAEYLDQFRSYLGLALKAQAQCRATLEALAEIKNPRPVQFVGQANIAQGPQQVNNGPPPGTPHAHADKSATAENKLMDTRHEQRLDYGTQGAAGVADSVLETVGTSDRAAHG